MNDGEPDSLKVATRSDLRHETFKLIRPPGTGKDARRSPQPP